MKKIVVVLFTIILSLIQLNSFSQSVAINTDGSTALSSAMLDVKSTTKGILIPRLSTTQRIGIATPATGLLVYDSTAKSFWYYNGIIWVNMASSMSSGWLLSGNSGTTAANFIGTTDAQPLRFKLNSQPAGIIDSVQGNTAIGYSSLRNNTIGYNNTANGYEALSSNTAGLRNTANGYAALFSNTTGNYNTANGTYSLYANTTGLSNSAFGNDALSSNTTGNYNTATGLQALYQNSTGNYNTANGAYALYANTTGTQNTAFGNDALFSNTTGNYNTASGYRTLYYNTTGIQNTANGYQALYYSTTGGYNTAMGYNALYLNTTGSYNIAIGGNALYSNRTGGGNIAIGDRALSKNTSLSGNIAIGNSALSNQISSGYGNNIAVGSNALVNNTSGERNTAIGASALGFNTTGVANIALGDYTLNINKTGSGNIAIGNNIGPPFGGIPNVTNTITIGTSANYFFDNYAYIGNFSTLAIGGPRPWSTFSDERIKNNIQTDVKGLDFITRLKPVTYYRSIKAMTTITGAKELFDYPSKYDVEKIKETGFLAQQVEQAAKASGYDFSGLIAPKNEKQLYMISYEVFVVPLVKGMQEQQKMIETLQAEIKELKALMQKR
jgi:trimeric autotransporter adhesin